MRDGFGHLDEVNRHIVEDHLLNPRNSKPLEVFNAQASLDNPSCGDEVRVRLMIQDARIGGISAQGIGCAICKVSASIMTEVVDDVAVADVSGVANAIRSVYSDRGQLSASELDELGDAIALHGVSRFPIRVKCALLAWMALEDAISPTRVNLPDAI